MKIWMPELAGTRGPKYLAIADAIGTAVADGSLPAGAKLPPQRNLAYDLGVTLGTITRAYREAERRGLVGGEVGVALLLKTTKVETMKWLVPTHG